MRSLKIIAALAGLGICGCGEGNVSSLHQPQATNTLALSPVAAADIPTAMVGTWHSREHSFLWDLTKDGHWKWWDLNEQSGRPAEPPMMAGTWFIRSNVLFLRIEEMKAEEERIGPGLAFTCDVKSLTKEEMILDMRKDEMKFRRIAEPDGTGNRSQPAGHGTNRVSDAEPGASPNAAPPHR